MEEDKNMLDEVMRDNSFIVFDNIKGQVIEPETRYEDGKSHLILSLLLVLVPLRNYFNPKNDLEL